ncbi:alpha-1,6-mannosyl-glycoprotein 2-beta-N-acetylglucosaminyltransferase-like [Uloborus diversus]|uniref:alpha-1,6-mannosyl-glycoprotein 2-beta-N-acetylglucosaminyltransferase-like n=1 Tax=Uloborus diversus TaxID=327109 RepID=UPI00240A163A|nr:alpha-1,6-mannosyl-glycoprotein 2-beta-N-acetylglucosaminyltransferase-like [Uloborus diversus]
MLIELMCKYSVVRTKSYDGMAREWMCATMLRRCYSHSLKIFGLIFVILFLWIELCIVNIKSDMFVSHKNHYGDPKLAFLANFSAIVNSISSPKSANLSLLSNTVVKINVLQTVANLETFGPLKKNGVVIVIQVHNRTQYLYALIESLKQAQYINQTLLVFSHDLFDVYINALIRRIDFAKVIQIFYPNSIQLHPNEFPGHDPNDCPRNMKREIALQQGCNNAKYPDLYGHYREAKFTQTKHHWWWKVNHLIDGLQITSKHTGPVLFLEEDHYVAPDFLYLLTMMENARVMMCPQCNILCLGAHVKSCNYAAFSRKVEITKWISSKHNMGMVINRSLWQQIKKCAKAFCSFDDYNWDWSLQHVSASCLPSPLTAMVAIAPRVFHMGECGLHHKGRDCSSDKVVYKVMRVLVASSKHLFPTSLTVHQSIRKPFKAPKGNGGWGDVRDHILCCSQVKNSSIDCSQYNFI